MCAESKRGFGSRFLSFATTVSVLLLHLKRFSVAFHHNRQQ
jgi:hypothetical protein